MKNLLIGVIVCLTCALAVSLYLNFRGVESPQKSNETAPPKPTEKTLELSNIEIIMYDGTYDSDGLWHSSETTATVSVAFDVKNISKEPERLWINNIALFDYNGSEYAPSFDNYRINKYLDRNDRLSSFEDINPNIIKKFYLTFVVPKDELYNVGITDNIKKVGDQEFVNKSSNIKCSYKSRKEMLERREELNIGKTPK